MDENIAAIENEILDQYVNDPNPRPWIVAFSGGKDSTLLLQLVWDAVSSLEPQRRSRDIHVVCNNTLVENPLVLEYVREQLDLIREAASQQSMPITVEHTTPSLDDTYWVNLIGRGYAAPNTIFRWCTERLKIKPTTRYIQEKVSTYGEAVILLGTRRDESSQRARSIRKYAVRGERLSKHGIAGVYVYAPLNELSTEQVWWHLTDSRSPWYSDHRVLVRMYRNASEGNECPLITDLSTPPCGNSRFGCWVCTLVTNDYAMRGFIESGDEWLRPLLELRDFLAKTINRKDPEYSPLTYRLPVRRNFQDGLGPYWPKWRKHILEELLKAEAAVQREEPRVQLITHEELVAIQTIWDGDFIYEFDVSDIVSQIRGTASVPGKDTNTIAREKSLLREACGTNSEDYRLISSLLRAHKNRTLQVRRLGFQKDVERILDEYLTPTFTDVYKKDPHK